MVFSDRYCDQESDEYVSSYYFAGSTASAAYFKQFHDGDGCEFTKRDYLLGQGFPANKEFTFLVRDGMLRVLDSDGVVISFGGQTDFAVGDDFSAVKPHVHMQADMWFQQWAPMGVMRMSVSAAETAKELDALILKSKTGTTGDCTWTLQGTDLTISGNGAMGDFDAPWGKNITSVTIENGVTAIGDQAFDYCTKLTSVTIPDSVTSIGDCAFSNCTGLTSVTIPDSVTEIGVWAFYGCDGLADENGFIIVKNVLYGYCGAGGDVIIPNFVTTIGGSAFFNCYSLTSVTIPDSVTSISNDAFGDCTSLTSVTISDSVTSIGYEAFWNCTSLTSVTIPDSVTSIGDYAFENCTSLTSVTIPDSVATIGAAAFSGCDGLADENGFIIVKNVLYGYCGAGGDVIIPDSVTSIGWVAFSGCTSLTSVTIGNGVTSIGGWAFENCTSLTSVTIPDSVATIGDGAFSGCTGLASVVIPDSVKSINYSTFEGCTGLTSVTIGHGVTSINDEAFYGCTSLTSLTVPDSVNEIGWGAFAYCTNLESIQLPMSIRYWDNYVFGECNKLTIFTPANASGVIQLAKENGIPVTLLPAVTSGKIDDLFWSLDGTALTISGNGEMRSFDYDYDEETDTYTTWAPWGTDVTSVTIEAGVTSIGSGAFAGCKGLMSVVIPDSVTSIGSGAFSGCSGLADENGFVIVRGFLYNYCGEGGVVVIPDSVTSINSGAFAGCSMTDLVISASVSYIHPWAFDYCDALVSITVDPANPVYYSKDNCLIETANKTLVLGCKTSVIPTDGSVTVIGDSAFYGCTGLTDVTIPDSVTTIEMFAFGECASLTSVTVPASVTYIGGAAFDDYDLTLYVYKGSAAYNYAVNNGIPYKLIGEAAEGIPGDLDGDNVVSDDDAIYLLLYTFFPDEYPIDNPAACDFDGDGFVSDDDAIWLLLYTFFPDEYPIA